MENAANDSTQPSIVDIGPVDGKRAAAIPYRLNDLSASSRYYVSMTDPGRVNELLSMRGIPLVKGKQMTNMPVIRIMDLDAKTLSEMEGNPGVDKVLPYRTPEFVDPIPQDTGEVAIPPPSLLDSNVDEVQGAQGAWSLGYTGAGVKIAIIDTGVDMAHPDLQGQQARYSSGPYAGWPMVYDDYSAILWSLDAIGGWVANTTATSNVTGGFVEFDNSSYFVENLTDADGNPVTSLSGIYHIGYHTDYNLIIKVGYPVAVLVVDTKTAGVYDTAYVDLLGDYRFSNDKPCTKGDEISYFDSYNATSNTTQDLIWNGGDGYADVSGGMVYWISDGVNVLPASNWTYGADFAPASGDAVAFVGEFTPGSSHGTMTASAALARGRTMGGLLEGMAPDAKLIAIPFTFNIYNSWMFAQSGADGIPRSGDEANIVSNSYGWSDSTVTAGYEYIDQMAGYISIGGWNTLWIWAAGNGGPGYGTTGSVVEFSSVRVGAGTTMQYRNFLGNEQTDEYSKWGDIAPFSNSGPTRTGKLNPEIIASGMYSLEPAPLNAPDHNGTIGDGSRHFQIGSGTSHAAPTVAGGAALGFQAYYAVNGSWPDVFLAKSRLMASADDMHYDPLKQGAGWLNATSYVRLMGRLDGTVSTTPFYEVGLPSAAVYPGQVYYRPWTGFPNFMLPGETDSDMVTTENLNNTIAATANISAKLLLRTGSVRVNHTTSTSGNEYVNITSYVAPGTDLLKVTMFIQLTTIDPNLDLSSTLLYNLGLDDWVDIDSDGVMNTTAGGSELFRYSADNGDCNYNQVMIRDPLERTHDGLIAGLLTLIGVPEINISLQIDSYQLQPFPWMDFKAPADTVWTPSLSMPIPAGSSASWALRVSVPLGTPVGTYAAAIYIDTGDRIQCMPVVINVPTSEYEFTFGGQSPFDTPYNNNFSGLANKQWRYDTGDWRMYWGLPSLAPPDPDAYLMVSVEWSERPTNIDVYVLAAGLDTIGRSPLGPSGPLDSPWGPGWDMTMIASSDDQYQGAGVFGLETNTGGPKAVVAAPLGRWTADTLLTPAPFAILTRCPVMAGNQSQDSFIGATTWVTMHGYEPGSLWLNITVPGTPLIGEFNGSYNFTSETPIEVRGGGSVDLENAWAYLEEIYQDSLTGDIAYDLAHAAYTLNIDVADVATLRVNTFELFGVPDLDLGLWLDKNRDGISELTEPFWYDAVPGSTEEIVLDHPESGTYLVKILGYNVTGNPGYTFLSVSEKVDGHIEATGFESPATSGEHSFKIAYNLTASPGTFFGEATFGFLGATDLFSIPVTINIIDQPVIENLTPADKSVIRGADLVGSFYFHDAAGANVGIEPSSVRVFLDGILNLSPWAEVVGNNVTIPYSFSLSQGWHSITVSASDLDGNAAVPVTNTFLVDSLIDTFSFVMIDPRSNTTIENGATVSLMNVSLTGSTDPGADVTVTGRSGSFSTVANSTGRFQLSIDLVDGLNVLTITTMNDANASASGTLIVVSDTVCDLTVDRGPALTRETSQVLTGVTESGASVTINGDTVPVSGDGNWTWTVSLTEGVNVIQVNATDAVGNKAAEVLNITSDRTAPALAIASPSNGTRLSFPVAALTGTVEPGSSVSVNGVLLDDVETSTGTWSTTVALLNGTNVITIIATDPAGNSVEKTVSVIYASPDYVTPDEQQDAIDRIDDDIKKADDFASLVMFIAIILFLISVFFTGAVWYVLGRRLKEAGKPGEPEESLEEIEEEGPPDVEREFEELEKEVRTEEGP